MNNDLSQVDIKTVKSFFTKLVALNLFILLFRLVLFFYVAAGGSKLGLFILADNYNIMYYALDYSNGLLTRGLAGELFGSFILNLGQDLVYWEHILKVIYSSIFYILMFVFIKKYLRTDNQMSIMLISMFMRPFYLNSMRMYLLKTDIFWYVCMIPIVLLLWSDSKKHFNLKMIGVLFCSAIAMLFHQAFIFVFAPLICAILLDKKENVWFFVYSAMLCACFLYLTIYCTGDYDSICNYVMTNLDEFGIWDEIKDLDVLMLDDDGKPLSLFYEYGDSRLTQLFASKDLKNLYKNYHLPLGILNAALCICSILTSFFVISKYYEMAIVSDVKCLVLTAIFGIPFLLLTLFTIDIDRWLLMTLTSLNVFAIYVAQKYNLRVLVNTKWLNISFTTQIIVYPVCCFYG